MKTAGFIQYCDALMRIDYQEAAKAAPDYSVCYGPIDFGAIDAPVVMAAGSTRCHEWQPGRFLDMARAFRRGS